MPRTATAPRMLAAGIVSMLVASAATVEAQETAFSTKREFWTADQLYNDFLAEFGGDTKSCYIDYSLKEGPPPPDGPQTLGKRWRKAIIAIDASGSMVGRTGGERKIDAAKAAVRKFLDSVPPDAEVGLLAFGHRGSNEESGKAESCQAVELLSGMSKVDKPKIADALNSVKATGWTPLAAAITKAGQSLTPTSGEGEQVVFVVSDGLETCGGDPVAAARALRESDVKAVVNIIGFNIPERERKALGAVAAAGGGTFANVTSGKELEERLRVENANLEEKVAYDTKAVQTKSSNNTSAMEARSHANTCVLGITNSESTRFLELSNRMVENGQTDSAAAREAYDRLQQRHEKLKAEMRAFEDRVSAELKAVDERIEQERERVKAAYDKK